MAYAVAAKTTADEIPVVDISGLIDGSKKQEVAEQLHAASKGLGFIYVRGHGIPNEVINETRATMHKFFELPNDEKGHVAISEQHRGWLAAGGAKMHTGAKADLKESFIWGYQDENRVTPHDHPLRGDNQWLSSMPELETISMRWFDLGHKLAANLMRGFALGLGLEENFFLSNVVTPLSRSSAVYYPPQPESMGDQQFGVGAHTDFGVLTVLCQDSVGGLQVENVDGVWIEAPPLEGTLLVNVGDLLHRWTEGEYKSTPHRVVNSSGKSRLSLVLAWDPEPDTIIDARDTVGDKAKQDAITCGDYLNWRFEQAFAYRKKSQQRDS